VQKRTFRCPAKSVCRTDRISAASKTLTQKDRDWLER
jgi:hypothetical protein